MRYSISIAAVLLIALMAATLAGATSLSIASITPSSPTLDNGQSITITGTWAGGIAPYNAIWYTGPKGTTCPQETANVLATYNGLSTTSNSITVSPTTTNSYCLGITDSESPQVTQLSLNYTENAITSSLDSPQGMSFSPSGTYAYMADAQGLDIINTASNTVVNFITSGFNTPKAVAISSSGTYAYVTNAASNNVVIINTASNTVTGSINSGFNIPQGVSFSPSGTYAYVTNCNISCTGSGPTDNVVIINTATNTVVNSITSGLGRLPYGVAFSPSGTYAYVTNYNSNNVSIINTATNTVVNSIIAGFNSPDGVSFSPSGTYAYVTNIGSSNVAIINTASNTVTGSIASGLHVPQGVAFSPSGTYAYVTNCNSSCGISSILNNAIIINPGVGAETTNLIYSNVTVYPALGIPQISPSNPVIDSGQSIILSFSWSGGTPDYTASLYSSTTSTCNTGSTLVQTLSSLTSGSATFSSVSPTSNTWYCTFVTDSSSTPETTNSISSEVIINPVLSAPTISPSNPTIDSGQSVTFSSTWSGGSPTYGASLYSSQTSTCNQQSTLVQQDIGVTSGSAAFSTVNPSSDTYYCTFVTDNTPDSYSLSSSITSGFHSPEGVAFSPSGTYAYVTNLYAYNVVIVNTASNTLVNSITSGISDPEGVSFSPSGTYAYVANGNSNNVVIINTASNTVVNSITSGFSSPVGVSFSPSGTYAYVVNNANVVIINTATNTVVNSIISGFSGSEEVAISPSGTYAYVANLYSSNVVIINTATNTVSGSINSGFNEPEGVAFSPSGAYAYVANPYSNKVAIINTASNTVTASITSGISGPVGVAFSPSGAFAYVTNYNTNNVVIINTGISITNSIDSEAIVNQALSAPTISPSNTAINNGQSVTFSSTWSGGTSDYTAKLYSSTTSTCTAGSTLVQAISSLTTGSTAFNPVTPTSTTYYCIFITDSATIPITVNSINSEVTLKSSAPQISNPYAGGPTGYFGPNSTLTSSTTSTISSSSTSTILPVTTIVSIIASTGTTKICNDTSGYTVNYTSLNATMKIAPESGCFSVNVINSTLQSKKLNKSVITALNYTVNNTNVSADMILHYSCSIPNSDVAPFILRNGTWQEITPFTLNFAACTVEFAVPSDPVIALLNTNVTSTINTTTATTTIQTSTTVPVTSVPTNTGMILEILIIVIIVIIAVALFLYFRRKR
jgi:YVTN family beta-propeller protein